MSLEITVFDSVPIEWVGMTFFLMRNIKMLITKPFRFPLTSIVFFCQYTVEVKEELWLFGYRQSSKCFCLHSTSERMSHIFRRTWL